LIDLLFDIQSYAERKAKKIKTYQNRVKDLERDFRPFEFQVARETLLTVLRNTSDLIVRLNNNILNLERIMFQHICFALQGEEGLLDDPQNQWEFQNAVATAVEVVSVHRGLLVNVIAAQVTKQEFEEEDNNDNNNADENDGTRHNYTRGRRGRRQLKSKGKGKKKGKTKVDSQLSFEANYPDDDPPSDVWSDRRLTSSADSRAMMQNYLQQKVVLLFGAHVSIEIVPCVTNDETD